MADDDFQVIINNEDYQKLQTHEQKNKELKSEIQKLLKENAVLKSKNKDLTKSVYVRDTYIEQLVGEFESAFGEILGQQIISSDMTKSFYQDIVSHQQNGISSIELHHALEFFTDQNKKVFSKVTDLTNKFSQQARKIKQLENLQKKSKIEIKQVIQQSKMVEKNPNKELTIQKQQLLKEIEAIKHTIQVLSDEKFELDQKNKELNEKNKKISKQIQILSKKRDTSSEKSYVIKLMVDEYYNEIQQNLIKIGGLSNQQITTVVANEMKGILFYIENLSKKASRRY